MTQLVFFECKNAFHKWLAQNHNQTSEVWLGFYKKGSGQANLTWSESVDVALCFGWIDGIRKTIDADKYKIRFTPRNINSVWSAVNVKKAQALIKSGKMTPEGERLFHARKDKQGYSSAQRNVILAKPYEQLLKNEDTAWTFFQNLAPSYKRESIWWVMSAKKKETQIKRLQMLIESSKGGMKIPPLRK